MSDDKYFLRRAAAEVDAAHRAISSEARRAHYELADRYSRKIEDGVAMLNPSPGAEKPFRRRTKER